jgi:hypothetical protein
MKNNKTKNSLKTQSYFIKRLKDSGFIVWKLFDNYGIQDPRCWTVLVDPGGSSVIITCYVNKEFNGDLMFELNDGGQKFHKNFSIKTESLEVIITHLVNIGVNNDSHSSPYHKDKYINNGKRREQEEKTKKAST